MSKDEIIDRLSFIRDEILDHWYEEDCHSKCHEAMSALTGLIADLEE